MANFKLKKGVDIPLKGKPEKKIVSIQNQSILKLHPISIKGIKPKLVIKEGDQVKTGSVIFLDKILTGVSFVSPGTGVIKSIKLGERRVVEEICIDTSGVTEDFVSTKTYTEKDITSLNKSDIKSRLMEAGCWPYIRQRPFSNIANPEDTPKSIFISGFNSAPHSLDIEIILNENNNGLQAGINALSKLTDGKIHISVNSNQKNTVLSNLNGVEINEFSGPHPAGNVGIQIHHIDPINVGEKVWYIDIQDVMAIGSQLLNGKYSTDKFISISGEGVINPSFANVRRGTTLSYVLKNKLNEGHYRFISGDVLSGKKVEIDSGLGFYHSQIAVLPEGGKREFIGWLKPGTDKFTLSNTYLSRLFKKDEWSLNTSKNGDLRAIIPFGYWENMLPMDIIPNYLVRSILAKDIEEMEQLGIYECDEEDFALCSFVCQSKFPVHQVIREGLEYIEQEG